MKPACKAYGHNWSKNLGKSLDLPYGYIVEECQWCGEERSVLEY